MIIIIILALLSALCWESNLLDNSTQYTDFLHQQCVDFLIKSNTTSTNVHTVLCGTNISNFDLETQLSKTSLLHLFIISGSHLILLNAFFRVLHLNFFIRQGILLFYSLITKLQAPVLRALIGMWCQEFLKKFNLSFPADLRVLITGLIALTMQNNLWDSRSLQLSWLASLGLAWAGTPQTSFHRAFYTQLAIYISLFPALYGFGNLHPLSVVFNLLLGSIFGGLLIPAALLATMGSSTQALFDQITHGFFALSNYFTSPIQISKITLLKNEYVWIWIFTLHFFAILWRRYTLTGKDSCRAS